MTDLHLIAFLKQHGWKLHTRSALRNWTKERLIDEIECLENNWGCSLEREEISFKYEKKLVEENQQLKEKIEKMKNHNNCKWFHEWNLADIMDEPLDDLSPCQGCKNFSLWEFTE